MTARLRILTWHVHGNYLYSLTQVPHEFIVPVMPDGRPGYAMLGNKIPWGGNVRMVPADQLRDEPFDCVIYQSRQAYEHDRLSLLTSAQQALPSAYIEHNPPEPHPTDTRHFFQHGHGVLVHVTHYNALMWDAGGMPDAVIEHGVPEAEGVSYGGELERGIVVINNLGARGRRVGADVYEWARSRIPLDLIGMGSESMAGGKGEIDNMNVPAFVARYRFFFTPIRYASLGLSLIEAMMAGVPVVGVAATELPRVIQNGINGYVDNRRPALLDVARQLLADAAMAREWGEAARRTARERYNMTRFVADWERLLFKLTGVGNV
ncbi:glycosyltransferase family 4 protein [Pusillimonas sp. SM2304]|uniref:glycosyltransferase n=1 Tax=Pusillimonas sp. SM2304 TaxID=3073241 RepID=UPI002874141E|nr:glycosyltransferase family 4 protein [Pusillimonas sp. SM2304]MDS1139725.1 glycosyltransferase family 4 protein [Pusillimonas sp. SM2304]